MQHHLILVREMDQQMSGSGCCGRVEGDLTRWVGEERECFFPERRALMNRVGEVYRAVREAFGRRVRITVLDPRNQVSFLPMVLRDALRYRVAPRAALRTLLSAGPASAVLDGEVLFRGEIPPPEVVLDRIAVRLLLESVPGAAGARG